MGKAWTAIAAMVLCVSATPVEIEPYLHDESAIVLVSCQKVMGRASGSAFKVGRNTYVTAAHVVKNAQCSIDGAPITVTSLDDKRDYATFTGPSSPVSIKASCEGFKSGKTYIARGYPGGNLFNIFAPWMATGAVRDGFSVMYGEAIPGMSGGPVIDENGVAVGVVNMRWPARSMALKSTGYCRR